MRAAILTLILSLFSLLACSTATPQDREAPMADPLAQARAHFQRAVADAYAQPLDAVKVQPVYAGLPDNPYDALKTGDLYAVRADWPGQDPGPGGFAAASGELAYAKHPKGLQALMQAAHVLDPATSLSAEQLVARVAWVYSGFGKPTDFHPSKGPLGEPTLTRADGGAVLVYHAMSTGGTGSTAAARITVTIGADGSTSVKREAL